MTMWRGQRPLVLASQSQARQALLGAAGIEFESIPARVDERALQASLGSVSPDQLAIRLAKEKALVISPLRPGRYVVGADQTLAAGDTLFNKPASLADAARQLRALAGRVHELHSAVAVARDGIVLFAAASVARMTMRPLSDADIAAYLDQAGERVTASVGAYQLEGVGVHLFERIDGDHYTILGLPLLQLLAFLRGEGLLAL